MNVIIEKNIPFIHGYLDDIADVRYLSADEITREAMKDADALITRTRTRCDASLLDGSRCKFIATATIGTDHIDLGYCRKNGIAVANAPGCNAPAVAQYVFASVAPLLDGRDAGTMTMGIVGVGNVGKIVERWARQLGFRVLLCDPPRSEREGADGFCDFSTILSESDIITFHTPLTREGKYPTYHLLDAEAAKSIERCPVIINAARGGIVDNSALVKMLDEGVVKAAVIDCWENEPDISGELLDRAVIATPHIAGYSREGKIRATQMSLDAFCRHFNLAPVKLKESVPAGAAASVTWDAVTESYSPQVDTASLKQDPAAFESLRNTYAYRPEVK
ncbi:MAG: 4-phosphoerythronate dehydrogenase [Bacteroides sp.]|nr:4-phosphoerythronate dehydrogenase [Bacteroides sp.]MCM1390199.1 4-phosphoerythronate dehydrogenase [Bacteroides sp.]